VGTIIIVIILHANVNHQLVGGRNFIVLVVTHAQFVLLTKKMFFCGFFVLIKKVCFERLHVNDVNDEGLLLLKPSTTLSHQVVTSNTIIITRVLVWILKTQRWSIPMRGLCSVMKPIIKTQVGKGTQNGKCGNWICDDHVAMSPLVLL
jgi:hypothetical protein